jgi:serine protease Do
MYRSDYRWGIGIAAVVVLALLYFGLRGDRTPAPPPQPISKTATAPETATDQANQTGTQAPQEAPTAQQASQSAATGSGSGADLTPKAAAQAPAVPNFVDLVKAVKPAVVSIRVKSDVTPQVTSGDGGASPFEGTPLERFFGPFGGQGRERQAPQRHFYAQAQGSGFVISSDGDIVTNNHVVASAVKLEVVMDDGTVHDAKVVGTDPKTDLALLKVDGLNSVPFVTLSDEPPQIGEWVVAMGNPFGLGGTVTLGIVSAHGRDIGSGPYSNFLQIDAAVNRGNSGGPAFNMSGRVIGVNTAIFSPSGGSIGIAFAIPAATVKAVIGQLKERGYVERGWIGVQVQPVTKEIADSLGMSEPAGALVADIEPDSPAATAGLKAGDVVIAINGDKVKDSRDLARTVGGIAPNTRVAVEYLRDGKTQTASLTLGQLKDQTAQRPAVAQPGQEGGEQTSHLGISVAPAARVLGIGEQGLAVLRIDPNGKAAEAGLRPGDVILQVGGKELSSPQDLTRALTDARSQRKQHVLAMVRRNDRNMFVALPVAAG